MGARPYSTGPQGLDDLLRTSSGNRLRLALQFLRRYAQQLRDELSMARTLRRSSAALTDAVEFVVLTVSPVLFGNLLMARAP
ncbi:hypothetical protein EEJ42_37650 [Streptomyces botrytidirepellens]|uniref:Uncharacterized protein n=1 Tax=Streptomyces botrytidirepellens TaxID=2486417 RepID=A0A3M8TPK6_9ACTN|nr:hypothetical protein EEJ42_37650 [Streptomyces botrytidirepellens]